MTYLLIVCLVHFLLASTNADFPTENDQRRVHFEQNAKFVDEINSKASTYKAFHHPQFAHFAPEQLSQMAGGVVDPELRLMKGKHLNGARPKSNIKLPLNFEVSQKWPQCKSTFGVIHNQGLCGSCYAVSTASALTDRRCIASNGKQSEQLSSWDIVSCCPTCADKNPKKNNKPDGCYAGYPLRALQYFDKTGIVSGGDFGSHIGCVPYPNSPNATTWDTTCRRKCQSQYPKKYKKDKHRGKFYWQLMENVTGVMEDIYLHGPVTAVFDLYEDFNWYHSGVYKHTHGKRLGGHVVRVVGWGVDSTGTKYWKVANSYGPKWGENGYFRILRGVNEVGFEDWMMGSGVGNGM